MRRAVQRHHSGGEKVLLGKSQDGIPMPKEICKVLDDYVIGQHHAKKVLSVALIPILGADHFTILEELRRPNGRLVRAAVELGEELGR
jgi:ATP-dependent protease Clp ATPase subunit